MQKEKERWVYMGRASCTQTHCQGLEKDGVRRILGRSRFPVFRSPDPLPQAGFVTPEPWVVSEHSHLLSPVSEKPHLSPGAVRGFGG